MKRLAGEVMSASVADLMASMSVPAMRRLQRGQVRLDRGLLVALDLVALLPQELLGLVHEGVGVVADLGLLAALAVLLGVGLGVLHHLVDVSLSRHD